MKKDQVYAIVDIESTGGSIGTDRMIQFACILLENGKILESFDTFVNPLKGLPKRIQELTGISPSDLHGAPLFEDLAPLFHSMLEDTIFVAHNVGFDFQFLNEEFARVGLPKLTIPAIDTVELSQVLFPSANSFALQDIAEWLGYDLDRPHNALFDAEATAFLLNQLDDKLHTLPLTTVETLTKLSDYCIAETYLFFQHALEDMKMNPTDLDESLIIVEGIALKNPEVRSKVSEKGSVTYPEDSKEKQMLLNDHYLVRTTQETMMDAVYQYFKDNLPEKGLAIEAPPGSGKSFGYLLPLIFLAKPEDPVVISTKTTVLQRQIIEETLDKLAKLVPFEINAVSIKGKQHYLSLAQFHQKLSNISTDDIEALFSMRILVWLTETQTGDLDELGIGGNSSHDFWSEIRTGLTDLPVRTIDQWRPFDFYTRLEKQINEAAILVTNHAYLVHDLKKDQPVFAHASKVVVDEAHFFPDIIQDASTDSISFQAFSAIFKQFGTIEKEASIIETLHHLADRSIIKSYQLEAVESNKQVFESEWQEFIEQWLMELSIREADLTRVMKWKEVPIELSQLPLAAKRTLKELTRLVFEVIYIGNHIIEAGLKDDKRLTSIERYNLLQFNDLLAELAERALLLKQVFSQQESKDYAWVSYFSKNPSGTLRFNRSSSSVKKQILELLKQWTHTLFTSSTLSYNQSIDFFQNQLQLEHLELLSLETTFDYPNQVRVYAPNTLVDIQSAATEAYVEYLADAVVSLTAGVSANTLILFRSMDTLQRVYRVVQKHPSMKEKLVLAQNVSGTKSKLLKQFKKNTSAVLLGADTFWEGIDLPGDALKVVIVTRLPFDSPELPSVKRRHMEMTAARQNPFVEDTLPRAVLRMKQGFGRLIRSNQDKGVFIVLDPRFIESSYASVFKQILPDNVPIERREIEELTHEMKNFLSETDFTTK
ncbi:helicase C-terminal domain-containing protein [Marinilactibacillus piezotolerans]|uniref:helicase C-terminal domain-containing protein n=1 Tax=Marinilactibacillus piezotolerans TaxID=258723 RepID=UPI0009B0A032|nr:helicase C-terminal domain-containing protein [Marinilactibacillus piezotolerans]